MEPLNCVAARTCRRLRRLGRTQIQSVARRPRPGSPSSPAEKVHIHTQYLGGGFGRRGGADFIGEAVEIAKAVNGTR